MTTGLAKTLEIRTSPHILSGHGVDAIMFNVVLALVPTTMFAVYAFGLTAIVTLGIATSACLITERLLCRVAGNASTLNDWSAAVTGLLYGLTLPPGLPLWMVIAGGAAAVGFGKAIFGGLGVNPFNPALVGRALLQAAFPAAMTTWEPAFGSERFVAVPASLMTPPFTRPLYDGLTGATPLALWKFDGTLTDSGNLALGLIGGSTGETCSVLILLGGAYLIARNMMRWQTPAAILGVVAAMSGLLHLLDPARYASPAFMLFSGGLMLGAVFMATDTVSSPVTTTGCLVYGALIGFLVMVIRVWGGMPEGVMYAILLGNAATPHFDRLFQPRTYGVGIGRRS